MSFVAQDARRRSQYTYLLLAILLLVLFVLLAKGWLVGRHVYTLWKHGMQLRSLAGNPGAVLQSNGPVRIKASLEAIEQALRGLRTELQPILRPTWLPWRAAQQNFLAGDELLRVGVELAQAGQVACDGLQSVVDAIQARMANESQATQSINEALFVGLVAARSHFQEAGQQVGRLHEDITVLAAGELWPPLTSIVGTLEHYLQLGQAALGAAAAAPTLLGEAGPVNYLILAQNNDELRATGGFITGIGLLTIERGKIDQLVIKDSYDFDKFTAAHPFAPEPMQRHMGIILWVTRDGNWSPDFPTSAQAVENLYHLENSTAISGVVAFDMFALQALVKAIGPLYVGKERSYIDEANVLQEIRDSWAPELPEGMTWEEWSKQSWRKIRQEWWVHRKDFMGALTQALMTKLQKQKRTEQLSGLLWAVKQALDEKHILLYFHEPAVQELLATNGRDGALDHSMSGDYLLPLDTNMGYNKVNLNVEKLIEYQITLGPDTAPQATLVITYNNHSPVQPICDYRPKVAATYDLMAQDCYWNYLRVYAPLGSQLLVAEGVTETETLADEGGKTVFGAFLIVPAGESQAVRFTYRLPDLGREEYRLLVQKQAGTEAVPLRVRVVLPPNARLLSAEPRPHSNQDSVLSYDLDLRQDRSLALKLR